MRFHYLLVFPLALAACAHFEEPEPVQIINGGDAEPFVKIDDVKGNPSLNLEHGEAVVVLTGTKKLVLPTNKTTLNIVEGEGSRKIVGAPTTHNLNTNQHFTPFLLVKEELGRWATTATVALGKAGPLGPKMPGQYRMGIINHSSEAFTGSVTFWNNLPVSGNPLAVTQSGKFLANVEVKDPSKPAQAVTIDPAQFQMVSSVETPLLNESEEFHVRYTVKDLTLAPGEGYWIEWITTYELPKPRRGPLH